MGVIYKDLSKDTSILYNRLRTNSGPWTDNHTKAVQRIKSKVKCLPCLSLANPNYFKIVETDASDNGYSGILKQVISEKSKEVLVRFYSGKWNPTQAKYSTIKRKCLQLLNVFLNFKVIY
jgi:hypothetical protein